MVVARRRPRLVWMIARLSSRLFVSSAGQRRAHLGHLLRHDIDESRALRPELGVGHQRVAEPLLLESDPLAGGGEGREIAAVERQDVAALARFGVRDRRAEPRGRAHDVVVATHLAPREGRRGSASRTAARPPSATSVAAATRPRAIFESEVLRAQQEQRAACGEGGRNDRRIAPHGLKHRSRPPDPNPFRKDQAASAPLGRKMQVEPVDGRLQRGAEGRSRLGIVAVRLEQGRGNAPSLRGNRACPRSMRTS